MSARRPIAGASGATAIALAILIALGVWQLHRRVWKQAILARIDAAESRKPRALGAETPPLFTRVTAAGTLRAAKFALYGSEVQGDQLGAQLVEVLDRAGLPPLLVVLGWVPTATPPRPAGGQATLTGYVRLPAEPNWLSPADDPEGHRFYTLNPATIGAALGAADAAPFTLVALGGQGGPPPIPAEALPRPPDNHLQYAVTWFGLAASLLGVFVSWLRR